MTTADPRLDQCPSCLGIFGTHRTDCPLRSDRDMRVTWPGPTNRPTPYVEVWKQVDGGPWERVDPPPAVTIRRRFGRAVVAAAAAVVMSAVGAIVEIATRHWPTGSIIKEEDR